MRPPACSSRSTKRPSTYLHTPPRTPSSALPPTSSCSSSFPTYRTCRGESYPMNMSRLLRVPEAARRLHIDGVQVYRMSEQGALRAGKGQDGFVYVHEDSVADYEAAASPTPS